MEANSWSSLQIINNRRSWIWKNKFTFNLISHQPNIDQIYLYAKDPYKAKYQLLVNKQESVGLKHCKHSKAFIQYSNDMDDIYGNIEEYISEILIVLYDMIADMLSNKKRNPIVTELFIRGRKLRNSLVFITQSCLVVPKNIWLNSAHNHNMICV